MRSVPKTTRVGKIASRIQVAVNEFNNYFKHDIMFTKWRHSIDNDKEYDRYYMDVTEKNCPI